MRVERGIRAKRRESERGASMRECLCEGGEA